MINLDAVYKAVFMGGVKMSYSYLYNLFSNICEYMSAYICIYTYIWAYVYIHMLLGLINKKSLKDIIKFIVTGAIEGRSLVPRGLPGSKVYSRHS